MAGSEEIIIDGLLCFLKSASGDFSEDALFDLAHTFYSHESIKTSKTTLANLLHKDITWRRDPEKKKKDLRDVVDFLKEISDAKRKIKFLSDSYKGMPPVGLEFIGPLISNLAGEVTKINDILPKILDIKSEVRNTADAVRNLKADVSDIKKKFDSAVAGIEGAANDITDHDLTILNDLRTFRTSISAAQDAGDTEEAERISDDRSRMSFADVLMTTPRNDPFSQLIPDSDTGILNKDADPVAGAVPKKRSNTRPTNKHTSSERAGSDKMDDTRSITNLPRGNRILEDGSSNHQSLSGDGWTLVTRKPRRPLLNGSTNNSTSKSTYRILGAKMNGQSSVRAVRRTMDVFLGRVDKNVQINDIKAYIKENFNVSVQKVEPVEIRSDEFNAFKVTVFSDERDKLFNADLWPQGMIVNKYYTRRVRQLQ